MSCVPPHAKWLLCWRKGVLASTVTDADPPHPNPPPPAINRHMLTCWLDQSHTHTWSALVTAASHGCTGCSSTWRTWGGDGEGRGQRTSGAGGAKLANHEFVSLFEVVDTSRTIKRKWCVLCCWAGIH